MTKTKTPAALRSEAYLAYVDGRLKRARELNKQADKLAAAIAKAESR